MLPTVFADFSRKVEKREKKREKKHREKAKSMELTP
jgi:hypothetical protein